jgi:hypothetical protein
MCSYMAKRNKVVCLLSNMHNPDNNCHNNEVPEIIRFYNHTKGGVDIVDQMAKFYSTKAASRRWPLQVFYNILDLAGINAYTLFQIHSQTNTVRRDFFITLAEQLTAACRERNRPIQPAINLEENDENQPPDKLNKRTKCSFCKKNLSRNCCRRCNKPACGTCSVCICKQCA